MKLTAEDIFNKALKEVIKDDDILEIHTKAYEILKIEKEEYYKTELNNFLSTINISKEDKEKVKNALLSKREVNNKVYSNFMEEIVIGIRQSIQPLSGSIAELCINYALEKEGLINHKDYNRRINHTDFTIYYKNDKTKMHRIEVKNVALRERGTRGLNFDGDSLAGFFNQPKEFTDENIKVIDKALIDKNGYCYVPITTLKYIKQKNGKRFKDINKIGKDMKYFHENGIMP
jgi:hypothetical protein